MLLRALFVALVLLCVSGSALSQRTRKPDTSDTVRLSKLKPTVFVEFVRLGTCRHARSFTVLSINPCESGRTDIRVDVFDAVWLRLVNNSRWPIQVSAGNSYVPPIVDGYDLPDKRVVTAARDRAEIDVGYQVEAETGCDFHEDGPNGEPCKPIKVQAPQVEKFSVSTSIYIPPGGSLIFAVRKEHLAKYLSIYVLYSYYWETSEKRPTNFDEPKHRVYFSWVKLEKAIGPTRKIASK